MRSFPRINIPLNQQIIQSLNRLFYIILIHNRMYFPISPPLFFPLFFSFMSINETIRIFIISFYLVFILYFFNFLFVLDMYVSYLLLEFSLFLV